VWGAVLPESASAPELCATRPRSAKRACTEYRRTPSRDLEQERVPRLEQWRVGVGAATRGADEEVAVGHAVRVALMWRSRLLATKEAGALPPALDARHLEVDPACGP